MMHSVGTIQEKSPFVFDQSRLAIAHPNIGRIVDKLSVHFEDNMGIDECELCQEHVSSASRDSISLSISTPKRDITVSAQVVSAHAIDVKLSIFYKMPLVINRECIKCYFALPLAKLVFENGRMLPATSGSYWLGRGGAVFGDQSRSAVVINPNEMSSLEADTKSKCLTANLDYAEDHPFILPDVENGWKDVSRATLRAGERRSCSFRLHIGVGADTVPRLLPAPGGYPSVCVWTEHGCNADLRPNKAVFFGNENITMPEHATGGFAFHHIPVTKSVFFDNPTAASVGRSRLPAGEMVSLVRNAAFGDFLDTLHRSGIAEICLHSSTPEEGVRGDQDLAISTMKARFGSVSWIDHLTLPRARISGNPSNFGAYGLDSSSAHYIADLWKQYDTRYFWNHAQEYRIPYTMPSILYRLRYRWRRLLGNQNLPPPRILQMDIGTYDHRPRPVVWNNPGLSGSFWSWGTYYVTHFVPGSRGAFRRGLRKLISNWGVAIMHAYFSRAGTKNLNACWTVARDGSVVISPEFNEMLREMARERDRGRVLFTTISLLVAHIIRLRSLTLAIGPNGMVSVENPTDEPVPGVSLACAGKRRVILNGRDIPTKIIDGDTIFSFDLLGRTCAKIEFV